MKIYSDTAVTKADVEAIDAAQTQAIKGLKFWIGLLACGTAINFALLLGLAFFIAH
jgi:hypothetical protein